MSKKKSLHVYMLLFIFITSLFYPSYIQADSDFVTERMALYKKTAAIVSIPWYYIAAMDQYERNITSDEDNDKSLIAIQFDPIEWYGPGNQPHEKAEHVVTVFQGIGMDGDGDGLADLNNAEDRLYTVGLMLSKNGYTKDDIKISLWEHYKRDLTVKTIINIAKVYEHFETIKLEDREFPVDISYNYSYNNTWGDRRGFGGNRIHEGTDIFASYGTPVKATTYGVVELKGWNLYGGWRIGVRDIHNIYHYYAHLNNYKDNIKVGELVQPGDILGTVGSSGYGPPGTSGKFPPHLHYGMYRDNGNVEWSFDPFPYLKRWEQVAKEAKRSE